MSVIPTLPVPDVSPDPVGVFVPPADGAAANAARAKAILAATDYVVIRAAERSEPLSDAWRAWRESLRLIVNGAADDIPVEPER
jgi:hypothetical protein